MFDPEAQEPTYGSVICYFPELLDSSFELYGIDGSFRRYCHVVGCHCNDGVLIDSPSIED